MATTKKTVAEEIEKENFSSPPVQRIANVLEHIWRLNRTTLRAVLSMGQKLGRQMEALRLDLAQRLEAIEAAVRQNSVDIRAQTEELRRHTEELRHQSRHLRAYMAELRRAVNPEKIEPNNNGSAAGSEEGQASGDGPAPLGSKGRKWLPN